MSYSSEDIKLWAEEYKRCLSFKQVANKFNINIKTINKNLKKYKNDLNIILPFEEYIKLKSEGKKKCCQCKEIKSIKEFRILNNIRLNKKQTSYICNECKKKQSKIYRGEHKEEISAYGKQYRKEHPDKIQEINKKRSFESIEANNKRAMERYYEKHEEERNKRNKRHKERMNNDSQYSVAHTLRSRFNGMLRNFNLTKDSSVIDLVGCSIKELVEYIEKFFYNNPKTDENMTWNNRGFLGWHIDHIRPLDSFDLTKDEDIKKAWHYTNLQPLWAKDNWSKGSKIIEEDIDVA